MRSPLAERQRRSPQWNIGAHSQIRTTNLTISRTHPRRNEYIRLKELMKYKNLSPENLSTRRQKDLATNFVVIFSSSCNDFQK